VAIARALAMRPALMLFDEVTSALDPELVGEVVEVMRRLAEEGMTMRVVTHEMGFAPRGGNADDLHGRGPEPRGGHPREMCAKPEDERTQRFLSAIL
jgi:ABC-type polar amino acid transport system ATPase subunit